MAKDDKPDDKPKPWTPADPLEDEEDEKEVQRRARANVRLKHLETEMGKPAPDDKKKKRSLF